MLVVLSEDSFVDPNTINGRELRATVEAARMFGCRESALQFCDVAACFQDLRARFPNSVRLSAEQARLQRAEQSCQEGQLHETAITCASGRESARQFCDVAACFQELRSRFPNAEQARLQRAEQSCQEERAITCASGRESARQFCDVAACFQELRSRFPNSARLNAEQARISRAAQECTTTQERELHGRAAACATERENSQQYCEVVGCFQPLRAQFPNSSLLNAERVRIDRAQQRCVAGQERLTFEEGDRCASSRPCDTSCFNVYRSRFPSGLYKNAMEASQQRAREACAAQSLPELFEVTLAHQRKQFELASAQLKELSTLTQKVVNETTEPIRHGIAEPFRLAS